MNILQDYRKLSSQDRTPRRMTITRFRLPQEVMTAEEGVEQVTSEKPISQYPPALLQWATFFYALILMGLTCLGLIGSDRWWWSALNQYLPQWFWLCPAVGLGVWFWRVHRRATWVPCLLALWVVFPIMDFRWSFHPVLAETAKGTNLRVMTYNVKNGHYGQAEMTQNIRDAQADIVLLQQAHGTYKEGLAEYFSKGWYVQNIDQYIFASRYPITEVSLRDLSVEPIHLVALRCRLRIKERDVVVYNVHLLSPRSVLSVLKGGRSHFMELMYANNRVRQLQAMRLSYYLKQEYGPVILTGDLNAPAQSIVNDEMQEANLYNAFNLAGRGYGYTYGHISPFKHDYVRIDHIFLSKHIVTRNCWTGSAQGSDHRPVLADLFLPDM